MIVVNDRRLPQTVVYDFSQTASVKVMERVVSLLNEEMLVEMLNLEHKFTLDVYLDASDIPATELVTAKDPVCNFFVPFGEFIRERSHVAICIDRIRGTLSMGEIHAEEQAE